MNVYQTLQIGAHHTLHCEDFLATAPLSSNHFLMAVLDGCTMGTESHFASSLVGKILRKTARDFYYQDFFHQSPISLHQQLKRVVKATFLEMKSLQNRLGLETSELLTTLVLGILDSKRQEAELLALGDGLISINGQFYEFDQGDKPDYMGYHLHEDFETWFAHQKQQVRSENVKDLSISTDGIFTFRNPASPKEIVDETELLHFMMVDLHLKESHNFLDRKIRHIEREWGLSVTDDLAMIRILL